MSGVARMASLWISMTLGCVSGGSSQPGGRAASPQAISGTDAVVPAMAAAARITAKVVQPSSGGHPSATILVEVAGETHEVVLASAFDSCESVEVSIDAIEAVDDDRLRMAQLFCDNGEDYLTRNMVTALLFAGPNPRLLWQGEGSYSNSMDQCIQSDVLHFRRGANGAVEVVRTTEVIAEEDVDPELLCEAEAESQTVIATIAIPAPSAP